MALIARRKYARDSSGGSITYLMRIVILSYSQIPSVPIFHNRAAAPSGAGSLRARLLSVQRVSRTGAEFRVPGRSFANSVHETWRTRPAQPQARARLFSNYRWQIAREAQTAPVRDHRIFQLQFANSEQSPRRQGIRKTRVSSSADSRNSSHRHFRQHPFATAACDRATLFHRLKRIRKRPAAHFPPRRPYLFGELGQRKRTVAA
jgi:hypothetical protein